MRTKSNRTNVNAISRNKKKFTRCNTQTGVIHYEGVRAMVEMIINSDSEVVILEIAPCPNLQLALEVCLIPFLLSSVSSPLLLLCILPVLLSSSLLVLFSVFSSSFFYLFLSCLSQTLHVVCSVSFPFVFVCISFLFFVCVFRFVSFRFGADESCHCGQQSCGCDGR